MITCIFTLDYEIFGSGKGTLAELAIEPAERLRILFENAAKRFVLYPEVAELELMAAAGSDPDIGSAVQQIRAFHESGFELGLHFHPWWYNARREEGEWVLDHAEYNLCTLSKPRIETLIDRGLRFLRAIVGEPRYTPLSYRAGHLLFQPAKDVVDVLVSRGIRLDSSVYKGGVWKKHRLDYGPAVRNGSMWRFEYDPNVSAPDGRMLEIPIHTQIVPTWRLLTIKRLSLERRSATVSKTPRRLIDRLRDVQLYRAIKFDYCAMRFDEMRSMIDSARRQDDGDPAIMRPLVAIGHTKDLVDLKAVKQLLDYLESVRIPISTFTETYHRYDLDLSAEALQC